VISSVFPFYYGKRIEFHIERITGASTSDCLEIIHVGIQILISKLRRVVTQTVHTPALCIRIRDSLNKSLSNHTTSQKLKFA